MPGNVFLPATSSGLPKDSVVNVTALVTLDKTDLDPETGHLPALMNEVDRGLAASWGCSQQDTHCVSAPPRQLDVVPVAGVGHGCRGC